jgi:GMP synthase (glutamine-hydrolysing)
MRILAVTHGALVGPELFGDVIRERGHVLVEWPIVERGRPPHAGFDAVIVLGGKQNVGEELLHPWLQEEYDSLRAWVEAGTPLLGVCLGAQTLAHALGAGVRPVEPAPLAGFYPTELTDDGADDQVLGVLPRRFEAMNANAYTFAIPSHAVELARGPVNQAFRAGARAWGVQFHPEVRLEQALAWFGSEKRVLAKPIDELERELRAGLPDWQAHGRRLCEAFLSAAADR